MREARPAPTALAIAALVALQAIVSAELPKPQGYVTDLAGVLDAAARARIESLLRGVEQETTAEIALVTVSSLENMTVEEYANRLFGSWGIGQSAMDNGVLVLVAPSERSIRIEVGYGLEAILPDGLAGEIIRTDFLPAFRAGDLPAGIQRGVDRVAAVVRKHETLSPERLQELAGAEDGRPPAIVMVPFFSLFVGVGSFLAGLGLRAKVAPLLIVGSLFAGLPFLMAVALFAGWSFWILAPLALGMMTWGHRLGGSSDWQRTLRESAAPGDTGWVLGGSSSASGSGSSSGSSFGGGSSGGGGASGRW